MKIKLNVDNRGSCAKLFVKAEKDEALWKINNKEVDCVVILHEHIKASLKPSTWPKNCINDNYLIFSSTMPFFQFCEQFSRSAYNDHSAYNIYTHNCADAASFALQLAGIPIPNPLIKLTRLSNYMIFPGPIASPFEMYDRAFNYQRKLLKNDEAGSALYSYLLQKLKTIKKAQLSNKEVSNQSIIQTENARVLEIICKEALQGLRLRPERIELYLRLLVSMESILQNPSSLHEELPKLDMIRPEFYERTPNFGYCVMDFFYITSLLIVCDQYLNTMLEHFEFSKDFLLLLLLGGEKLSSFDTHQAYSTLLALVFSFSLLTLFAKCLPIKKHSTPMSDAILAFSSLHSLDLTEAPQIHRRLTM